MLILNICYGNRLVCLLGGQLILFKDNSSWCFSQYALCRRQGSTHILTYYTGNLKSLGLGCHRKMHRGITRNFDKVMIRASNHTHDLFAVRSFHTPCIISAVYKSFFDNYYPNGWGNNKVICHAANLVILIDIVCQRSSQIRFKLYPL